LRPFATGVIWLTFMDLNILPRYKRYLIVANLAQTPN